jgi:hypothetical protein
MVLLIIGLLSLAITANLQWQKALGGTQDDEAHAIRQTTDGGFIIGGNVSSKRCAT